MNNPEKESFANRVSTVTQALLVEQNPDREKYAGVFQERLTNLGVDLTKNQKQTTELIVNQYLPPHIPASEFIAHMLVETDVFNQWTDTQRRFLLDFALAEDIGRTETLIQKEESKYAYNDDPDEILLVHYKNQKDHFTFLQNKLRQRASTSSPAMRK